MVVMNHRIHFQGAAAAARSLFELLLDLKMLSEDESSISVERFHAFPDIERFRVAKRLVNFHDSHPDPTREDVSKQRSYVNTPGKEQAIDQTVMRLWGKTAKGKLRYPKHWTGKTVFERASDLGSEYEELYYDVYSLLSWYIHSGSTGYAGLGEETMELIFGRSHVIAQRCFLEATIICAREMKISYAVEGFHDILEDLRLTPGKVIMNEQIKIIEENKKKVNA